MNEMISQHIHFPPDSSLLGLRKHIVCFIPTASFEMSQPGSGHGVGGSCSFSIMCGNELGFLFWFLLFRAKSEA